LLLPAPYIAQVIKAAGVRKDADWIATTHLEAADDLMRGLEANADLAGILMDNTSANVKAMQLLQEARPNWIYVGCQAHALSLLLKDVGKLQQAKRVFDDASFIGNTINNSEHMKAHTQKCQRTAYGKVR
jgi:hypothetical protein